MQKIRVCSVSELAPGEARRLGTTPDIAVFHVNGTFYALADLCTHATASMSEGYVEEDDETVECPIHSARFCLKTGKALCQPATEDLKTFPVEVVGDDIFVHVPVGGAA